MKPFSYNKKEKLKSRTQLEAIFASGKSFSVFPVKVFFLETGASQSEKVKAGVGVSARHFKKAVQRNRIKRLLREAYRLEKQDLYKQLAAQQKQLTVFFLYIDKEMPAFEVVRKKMKDCLAKLQTKLNSAT
ncbi:MAG: ribonuclease P protein component [Bacteroidota bacterium]